MMPYAVVLRAWAALLLLAAPLAAEEPPYLDFVRGLRAQGMPDLALEYLKQLQPNPPPGLAPLLPLEIAKAELDLAAIEPNPARRTTLQAQARADFEKFLATNPAHALAAEARLEIARLAELQGKALLAQARRQQTQEAGQAEVLRARQQFEEAAQQLQAATAQIDAQLGSLKQAKTPEARAEQQTLTRTRLRARLQQGINLLDQARTCGEGEAARRGELLNQAIQLLGQIGKRDPNDPIALQALAWLGRCHQENDDPRKARTVYAEVLATRGEAGEDARRLAGFFRVQALNMDKESRDRLRRVEQAAEDWLRTYPNQLDTPEGYGVRFELANAYREQALRLPKAQQRSLRARELLEKAQKLYEVVGRTENEYATAARENKLSILLTLLQERTRGDIRKLRDFKECYYQAQLEVARLNELKKQKTKIPEDQRQQHFRRMLQALERGLDLTDARDAPEEVNEARYLETYAFLTTGDYYAAAVAGEDLARTQPQFAQASLAGAYALRAYAALLARLEAAGAGRADVQADRDRLRSLAEYVAHTWPGSPAADTAWHMLGWIRLSEQHYPEAVAALSRVSASYPDALQANYQLAEAALKAHKQGLPVPKGQPSYQHQALAALAKIPALTTASDAGTVRLYFAAKLLAAGLYYQTKQFDQLEALADQLGKLLDGLDEKTRAALRADVYQQTLYATFGRAEAEYRAGHLARTRALLDPIVAALRDPSRAPLLDAIKERNPSLVRALLGLAVRASVQDDQVDRARDLLQLAQKTFPDNAQDILIQFLREMSDQIQQLRGQGESAKPRLERTVAGFTAFLEGMAQQQAGSSQPEVLLFLAEGYAVLDNHLRAADLAARVPEPRPAAGAKAPDPHQLQVYHAARILYVRELRLAKDFDRARATLQALQGSSWGGHNLELRKEAILLEQDQEHYPQAARDWHTLMTKFLRPRLHDNEIKKQYFECYYYLTYCLFQNALKLPNPSQQTQELRKAARYVLALEKAPPDPAAEAAKKRLAELVAKEPRLKEQYDQLKAPQ